jgi:hypothetical protein
VLSISLCLCALLLIGCGSQRTPAAGSSAVGSSSSSSATTPETTSAASPSPPPSKGHPTISAAKRAAAALIAAVNQHDDARLCELVAPDVRRWMIRATTALVHRPLGCSYYAHGITSDVHRSAFVTQWYGGGSIGRYEVVSAGVAFRGSPAADWSIMTLFFEQVGGQAMLARWPNRAWYHTPMADAIAPSDPALVDQPLHVPSPSFSCPKQGLRRISDPQGDVARFDNGDGRVAAPWLDIRSVEISDAASGTPCVVLTLGAPLRGPTVISIRSGEEYDAELALGTGKANFAAAGINSPLAKSWGERGSQIYLRLEDQGMPFEPSAVRVCVEATDWNEPLLDSFYLPNDVAGGDSCVIES